MPSRWPMPSENPPARLLGHAGQADQLEHLVDPAAADAVALGQAQQMVVGACGRRGSPWRRAGRRPRTAAAGARRTGRPLTVTDPAVGSSRPMIIRMVVDLPAPLGPRKPVTWPGRTSKLRSSTAVVVPYRLVRPWASIIASP